MSYIYKSFAIYLCGVEYILVSSAPLGVSQCQTSSPEKHSSHFESIISLFKLSPQPTIQPCMLLITGQVSSKRKYYWGTSHGPEIEMNQHKKLFIKWDVLGLSHHLLTKIADNAVAVFLTGQQIRKSWPHTSSFTPSLLQPYYTLLYTVYPHNNLKITFYFTFLYLYSLLQPLLLPPPYCTPTTPYYTLVYPHNNLQ